MICKHCGYEIDDSSEYCPFCGTKTEKEAPRPANCPHCGTPVVDNAAFCVNCGASLASDTNATQKIEYQSPEQKNPAKVLGIVGLCLAFFIPVAGLILGILALTKSKGESNNGTAKTLGILAIVFAVINMSLNIALYQVFYSMFSSLLEDILYDPSFGTSIFS